MSSRFVRSDVATLSLSNGDTLTVRRRLNTGETHARLARMSEQVDGQLRVKILDVPMATVCAYLLDWTFTDDSGAHIPIRGLSPAELETTINNLDPDDFKEVREAIDAHHAAVQEAREAEKKSTQAEPTPGGGK
jgi:hypothetical protein